MSDLKPILFPDSLSINVTVWLSTSLELRLNKLGKLSTIGGITWVYLYFEKTFLPSKSYIQDDVNPGKYTIFVGKASDPALVWRFDPFEIDVRVRKNETVFLELVTWSVGYVSRAKIEIVDKEFASDKLKSLQRALSSDAIDK